jgi:biopolymer transport protein ExbD
MKFPRNDKRKIRASVELTPLIDVVFQLLIFFMLSSTFVVQTSIPIEVPESDGLHTLDQKELSVTLAHGAGGPDDNGRIYVDDVEIQSWNELTSTLSELHGRQPEALVLIRPDARIPTARLVRVLGIANNVGIAHYGIAARPPEEEE